MQCLNSIHVNYLVYIYVKKSTGKFTNSIRNFLETFDDVIQLDFANFIHSQLANKVLSNDFEELIINALAILENDAAISGNIMDTKKYLKCVSDSEIETSICNIFREFIKIMTPVTVVIYLKYGKKIILTTPKNLNENFNIQEFRIFSEVMSKNDYHPSKTQIVDFLGDFFSFLDVNIEDEDDILFNSLLHDEYCGKMCELNRQMKEL